MKVFKPGFLENRFANIYLGMTLSCGCAFVWALSYCNNLVTEILFLTLRFCFCWRAPCGTLGRFKTSRASSFICRIRKEKKYIALKISTRQIMHRVHKKLKIFVFPLCLFRYELLTFKLGWVFFPQRDILQTEFIVRSDMKRIKRASSKDKWITWQTAPSAVISASCTHNRVVLCSCMPMIHFHILYARNI